MFLNVVAPFVDIMSTSLETALTIERCSNCCLYLRLVSVFMICGMYKHREALPENSSRCFSVNFARAANC